MFFTGEDAVLIGRKVQQIIMDYLAAQLNNQSGVWYPIIGQPVVVTNSVVVAATAYNAGDGKPLIIFGMPRYSPAWVQQDAITGLWNRRYDMHLPCDMTMSDHAAEREQPGFFVDEDHKLVSCFENIISTGFQALLELGLEQPLAGADTENQDSGMRRNPFAVTCSVNTKTDT